MIASITTVFETGGTSAMPVQAVSWAATMAPASGRLRLSRRTISAVAARC